jgi:hypothetical protein
MSFQGDITMKRKSSLTLLSSILPFLLTFAVLPCSFAQPGGNVEHVSSLYLSWDGVEIAVSGDYSYVAAEENGLFIMDISDLENPTVAAHVPFPGDVLDVEVHGDLLYVAASQTGFWILDVSDPTSPEALGSVVTYGRVSSIEVQGDYAFITNMDAEFRIIDVSDPTNPIEIGQCTTAYECNDVAVEDGYAYVSSRSNGLLIIDISDYTAPIVVGNMTEFAWLRSVAVQDGYAYLPDYYEGLAVLDLSNAPNLVQVGFYPLTGIPLSDIELSDNHAFIAGASGHFFSFDISDPTMPILLADESFPGFTYSIVVEGDLACIGVTGGGFRAGGMQTVDISDPSIPLLLGEAETFKTRIYSSDIQDNIICMVGEDAGMGTVDITDPHEPDVLQFTEEDLYNAVDVVMDGDLAYVAAGSSGLYVLDITDPANPLEIGWYDEEYVPFYDIALQDNLIYGSCAHACLQVIDVSDPTNPLFVGEIEEWTFQANGVDVQGNYVYMTNSRDYVGHPELYIYDVSNPANPLAVGELDVADTGAGGIDIDGNYVYMATGYGGLYIVDVSDPTTPFVVAISDLQYHEVGDVTVYDGYAFLAEGESGIRILNVSNPESPVQVGYYDTPGSVVSVIVDSQFAYVSDHDYFHILDHTPATSPPSTSLTLTGIQTVIPAGGGTLSYDAHFVYGLPYPTPGLAYWAIVETPAGTELGPFIIQPQFTANPGMDITVQMAHQVPAGLPTATYTYTGHIGMFPNPLLQDDFTFTKEGAAMSGSFDWSDIDLASWATSNGFAQLSADGETAMVIPTSYSLEAAYPNPFNASTTIRVNLPESADLKIAVFNLLGQRVALLTDSRLNAGKHAFTFDGNDMASGVYLVRATVAGKINEAQKVVLMK